jgi:hypothetical protein
MPENFKALRFPQDLGTNSSPNYITFMPEELSYEPTNYGNKADRGSGGLFGKSDGGSAFDIDLGAGNPFKQIGKAIGGQLESIADAAVDTVNAIGSIFDGGSLSAKATKFGKLVNGKVKIGDFILSSGIKSEAPQVRQQGSISLYLPDSLNATTSADYSQKDIGAMGMEAIKAAKKAGGGSIADAFNQTKSDSKLAEGVLAEVVRQSGQVGDTIAIAEGQIVNPYSYQVFGGMAHRTFNYTFDLVPRNSREAEEVKRICDMFLYYMLPSKGGGSVNTGNAGEHFLKMPSQWDIKYYRNGNLLTHHQQPFKCFLSSCDIQYGGDAENFLHEDGSPVKTSLTLSYIEIEPLIQNKVSE